MNTVATAAVGTAGPAPLLEVSDLEVSFTTPRGPVYAVNGVTFDVLPGESLGIVGESGSGKSVMARSIMGILPSTSVLGPRTRIAVAGTRVAGEGKVDHPKHFWGVTTSMIFQDPMTSLTPVLKVGYQISEPMRYHLGLSKEDARQRAIELMTSVGIGDPERRYEQYPHNLSGGLRQRICIAIALACSPSLLICDEPTTALDVTVQRQVLDLLQEAQRSRGTALILITHDMGIAAGRTDHVAVMYGGRIVEYGPTAELFRHPRHPYTRALIDSIPRLEDPPHKRLANIPGRPTTIVDRKPGCRFAARCAFKQDRCVSETPALEPATAGDVMAAHDVACFFPLDAPPRASKQSVSMTTPGRL